MPKYSYSCNECESQYEIWHGMTEEHTNCLFCGEEAVTRIPSLLGEIKINTTPQKVGDVVNKTIEDTKKEVKEYKRKLKKDFEK